MKYRIVKHSGAYFGQPMYIVQHKFLDLFWVNSRYDTRGLPYAKFYDLADAEKFVEYLQTDRRVHKEVVKVFE
jgi:hypothetical protein